MCKVSPEFTVCLTATNSDTHSIPSWQPALVFGMIHPFQQDLYSSLEGEWQQPWQTGRFHFHFLSEGVLTLWRHLLVIHVFLVLTVDRQSARNIVVTQWRQKKIIITVMRRRSYFKTKGNIIENINNHAKKKKCSGCTSLHEMTQIKFFQQNPLTNKKTKKNKQKTKWL